MDQLPSTHRIRKNNLSINSVMTRNLLPPLDKEADLRPVPLDGWPWLCLLGRRRRIRAENNGAGSALRRMRRVRHGPVCGWFCLLFLGAVPFLVQKSVLPPILYKMHNFVM